MASKVTPVLVDPQKEQNYLNLAEDVKVPSSSGTDQIAPWVIPVTLGLQVLTQLGSMWYNSRQQDKQNEFQESLINKQNAYNSPTSQLNRLLAAGVPYNTAMSYMNGTVGSSTQPMSGQAAPYTPVQPTTLGDYIKLTQASDEHDLAQSQVRLNDANAYSLDPENPLNVAQRVLHENQALLAGNSAEREKALMGLDEAQRQQALQNIKYLRVLGAKAKWEGILAMKDAKKRDEWLTAQIDSLAAKAGVDRATAARVLFELSVTKKYDAAMSEVNDEGRTGYQEQVYSQFLADLSQNLQNTKDAFFNKPIDSWNAGDMDQLDDWLNAVYYLSYLNGGTKLPGQGINKALRHLGHLFGHGIFTNPFVGL